MLSLWKKRSNETYPFLFFHVCTRPAPSNKHLAPLFPINKANQDCCNRAIENLQNKDCADLCTPIAFLMSRGCEAAGARLRLLVRSDGSSLRIEVAHSYKRNTHKDYKRNSQGCHLFGFTYPTLLFPKPAQAHKRGFLCLFTAMWISKQTTLGNVHHATSSFFQYQGAQK